MQQIRSRHKTKEDRYAGDLLSCNNYLVDYIDARWNTIADSLVLMYAKLVELGFLYDRESGQVIIGTDYE